MTQCLSECMHENSNIGISFLFFTKRSISLCKREDVQAHYLNVRGYNLSAHASVTWQCIEAVAAYFSV